jgi:hypothetical protein
MAGVVSERDDETVWVHASQLLEAWRRLFGIARAHGIDDQTLALACLTHLALTTITDRRSGNLAAGADAIDDLSAAVEALTPEIEFLEFVPLIVAPTGKLVM